MTTPNANPRPVTGTFHQGVTPFLQQSRYNGSRRLCVTSSNGRGLHFSLTSNQSSTEMSPASRKEMNHSSSECNPQCDHQWSSLVVKAAKSPWAALAAPLLHGCSLHIPHPASCMHVNLTLGPPCSRPHILSPQNGGDRPPPERREHTLAHTHADTHAHTPHTCQMPQHPECSWPA